MANEVKFETGIDFRSQKGINLGDPSGSADAVNLQTLQNYLKGITSIKDAVRVASTATVTVSAPGAAIDGVTLSNGDRVLLKNQSTASQNGIYTFTGSGTAMTRTLDADSSAEVKAGMMVFVSEGTANGNKTYQLTTDDPIVLATDSLTFAQVGAGTTYTAGAGLTETSGTFDVVANADNTIVVAANDIRVGYGVVARIYSTGTHAATTSIAITHGLSTVAVVTHVHITSTGERIFPAEVVTSSSVVTFTFGSAPSSNTLTFTIMG